MESARAAKANKGSNTEPTILFEDEGVLVIDKPAGLMVHQDGRGQEATVVEWFLKRAPTARAVGEPQMGHDGEMLLRSGVVHRLDRETSGVLVLAKTQEAFLHLKAQFHDRLVKKEYRAFVYGAMRERFGAINRQIGRSARDFRLRSAEHGARGTLREAVTDWECLEQGEYEGEEFSYLKVIPKTGRTHQIRVHLKAIGRPVVGDHLYGEPKVNQSNNLGLDRLALHAHRLEIELPSGQKELLVAPLPQSFEEALELLR